MMFVLPVATAVTTPVPDTVATAGLLLLHVDGETGTPGASPTGGRVRYAWVVWPTSSDGLASSTDNVDLTTLPFVILSSDWSLSVPRVAMIFALPMATPVTRPLPSTVAKRTSLEVHLMPAVLATAPLRPEAV